MIAAPEYVMETVTQNICNLSLISERIPVFRPGMNRVSPAVPVEKTTELTRFTPGLKAGILSLAKDSPDGTE